MTLFENRSEAGRLLARKLAPYANRPDVVLLALPRGGVPVAYEIAVRLHLRMEIFLVRKIGAPNHEEFAVGAIASGGIRYLNEQVVRQLGIEPERIDRIVQMEQAELERRQAAYGGTAGLELAGRTAILVDDGLATGSTMHAAVLAAKQQGPTRVVVAVPVAPASTCDQLRDEADEIVCLRTPEPFFAVGQWYEDFAQTTDDEVTDLLQKARQLHEQAVTART